MVVVTPRDLTKCRHQELKKPLGRSGFLNSHARIAATLRSGAPKNSRITASTQGLPSTHSGTNCSVLAVGCKAAAGSTWKFALGAIALLSLYASACADPVNDARATIIKKLRDPESARFTEVVEKPEAVCGLVNAKNQFGGYAGPRRFYYVTASKLGFIENGGDISIDMLDQMAAGYSKFCGH